MNVKVVALLSVIPVVYFFAQGFLRADSGFYLAAALLLLAINGVVFFFSWKKPDNLLKYWIGILFSTMFLDIVFANVQREEFFAAWEKVNYWYLVPALGLTVLSSVIQTMRWQIITRSLRTFSFAELYPSVMIGHMCNHLLPAKAGEFIKCAHVGKAYNISKVSTFSTIVVERIFDGILVLSFLLFSLLLLEGRDEQFLLMGGIGVGMYGTAMLGIVLLYTKTSFFTALVVKILPERFATILVSLLESLSEGLHILRNLKDMLHVAWLSFVMWVVIALSILPLSEMFSLSLPWYAPFLILACISLGLSIPSVPGGVGIISFATIFAVKFMLNDAHTEISDSLYATIVAFSLAINMTFVLPEILIGSLCAANTGLSLSGLRHEAEEYEETPAKNG